jgi:uncharacterized protein
MSIRHLSFAFFLCLSFSCLAAPEFPLLTGRVVDNASMLASSTRQLINQQLAEHEKTTTNQIVVATLPDLQGYSIEEFGYQLGRHWQVGQENTNNGVVLLVAKKERKIRIEVGYGLEGALTDALASNIIQTVIKPQFKKGNFNQGISKGVTAIIAAIGGEYKASKIKESNVKHYWIIIILFLLFWKVSKAFLPIPNSNNSRYGYGSRGNGLFGGGGVSGGGGGFSGGGGGFGGGGASGGW